MPQSQTRDGCEPPLPLFALMEMPYGTGNAVAIVVAPYLLTSAGYTITQATAVSSIALLPATLYFLYAPVTDFLVKRKTWYLIAVMLSALLGACTIVLTDSHRLGLITAILTLYQGTMMLIGASTGGLMTALLSTESKAKVGAWVQLGNQGVATFGFGLLVYLSARCSLHTLALITVCMMLPALAILRVREPARTVEPEPFATTLREFGLELLGIVKHRRNWPGLLLLLSPLAAAQLTAVLSGLTRQYGASATQLAFASGWGGGLFTVGGTMSMLLLPVRWNSLARYLVAGTANGVVSLSIALAPLTATTYVAGMLASNFASGMCYAGATGVVLSLAGHAGKRQGSRYALLNSISNVSIMYMVAMEGWGAGRLGARYASVIDGLGSLVIAGLAGVLFVVADRTGSATRYESS